MPTFDSVQVTGSTTLQGPVQVQSNCTFQSDLQINGNETVAGNFQVNANESVLGYLAVGASASFGDSIVAANRINLTSLPIQNPLGLSILQGVRYYATGSETQPGLVLPGTDGFRYVLYIDTQGTTPTLAIQRLSV